jgi:hypothetical protein
MKTLAVWGLAAFALATGCTIVAPGKDDGGMIKVVPIPLRPDALPPPAPIEASVLIVANLERSSANLADKYAAIMGGLSTYLEMVGLKLANMGLIATYGDHWGPRLLLGRRAGETPDSNLEALLAAALQSGTNIPDYDHLLQVPQIGAALGNISDDDMPIALRLLASSGNFDGDGQTSEAKNLIDFGRGLGGEGLSPLMGGIQRGALFDTPRGLFIVVYLQPLPRRCAELSADCMVDGRSPADIFTETDSSGAATWLNFAGPGINAAQVLHVSIATSEGESLGAFRTRCGEVPGMPRWAFDVMAPSSNQFFTPLMAALNAAHPGTGSMGDFCELIGEKPDAAVKRLGISVATGIGGAH